MLRPCQQCDTENVGRLTDETVDACRVRTFTCTQCGAEGSMLHHSRAGIMGMSGAYFEETTDD